MSMDIQIGIDEQTRREIADGMGRVLADTYLLYFKTHAFHWNVTGPMFETLHNKFEAQYNEMWAAVDDLAERIRTLGFPAPSSGSALSRAATVEETDGVPAAKQMIRLLVRDHEAVVRTIREVLPVAQEADDESTVALLSDRLVVHEKTAWMLRSFLDE